MSAKSTIKVGEVFHLYEDETEDGPGFVRLELETVDGEMHTAAGGAIMVMKISKATATDLGLLP
jgi:hypothetical protein